MTKASFKFNKIYKPVFNSKANIFDIAGGRGRGGSHFVTDYFLFRITQPNYFRGYFMRFIQGDIRGSLWQDFKDRVNENSAVNEEDFEFNDSRMEVVYLPTSNTIKSKGFRKSQGSQTAKLKSIAGATDIAIEECEEIGEDDFNKLADSLRTSKAKIQIFRIWNPPNKDHWLIKNHFKITPNSEFESYYNFEPLGIDGHLAIISTYKDNLANLNNDAIKRFEGYRLSNPEHYASDIAGLVSSGIKGQIYKDWQMFRTLPDRNYFRLFAVDFGFVNDPTTLCELFVDGDRLEVYIYERYHQTHTINRDLIKVIKECSPGVDEIVCDNSEPSEIADMQGAGLNSFKTKKGGKAGNKFKQINIVKGYKVFYHEDSKNIAYEQNNYKWAVNSDTKEPTNKPVDKDDHLMDAILYGINYYHRNYR